MTNYTEAGIFPSRIHFGTDRLLPCLYCITRRVIEMKDELLSMEDKLLEAVKYYKNRGLLMLMFNTIEEGTRNAGEYEGVGIEPLIEYLNEKGYCTYSNWEEVLEAVKRSKKSVEDICPWMIKKESD